MKSKNLLKPAAYQLVPLLKLVHNNLNAVLISDGVGVGKTISAAYILVYTIAKYKKPAIVVCPPSLLEKWKNELESKFQLRAEIISSGEEFATMQSEISAKTKKRVDTVYILPSSMLHTMKLDEKIKLSTIVFDEIHNFRNKDTRGYTDAKEIATHAEYKVGLSATPVNNSLDDLVSALSILLSDSSWDAVNMTLDDLWILKKEIITNSMVTRFTKENLGIHFAKRNIISHNVNFPVSYIEKIKNIIDKIPSSKNSFFEKVTYYRLAASSSQAFCASVGITENILKEDPKLIELQKIIKKTKQEKWVIFCEFSETAKLLAKTLSNDWEIFSMTGETPLFSRQKAIEGFREAGKSILVMTPVGSEGLDIQFCSGVINYDLHWNPMKIEQRIGRIDRVGQKKNVIDIVNLIVDGSIDQRILQVINRKLSLITNSVFELQSFIQKQNKKKLQMFDQNIVQNETEKSEKLFKSMKNWSSLPIEDYSVISKINKELCDIVQLRKNSKSKDEILFKNKNEFHKWKKKFEKQTIQIAKRINLYN